MLHQDASLHFWVRQEQWDLVITMDDATGEIYSAFFVDQEGRWSSMRGVREVLERKGLFASLYTDRGSHYWTTPEAGGDVDKENLTHFGRAMSDGRMSVFHGSERLGIYDCEGVLLTRRCEKGEKRSGKTRRRRFTSASSGSALRG